MKCNVLYWYSWQMLKNQLWLPAILISNAHGTHSRKYVFLLTYFKYDFCMKNNKNCLSDANFSDGSGKLFILLSYVNRNELAERKRVPILFKQYSISIFKTYTKTHSDFIRRRPSRTLWHCAASMDRGYTCPWNYRYLPCPTYYWHKLVYFFNEAEHSGSVSN